MKGILKILFLVILFVGKVNAAERDYYNLHSAIFEKDLTKLEHLLKDGANPNIMQGNDILTRPLLVEAIRYGKKKKVQLVEILLRFGADPNLLPPDDRAFSVLETAILYGYENSFILSKLLLFHGANPNIRSGSAMCLSVRNFDLLNILINVGGDLNTTCDVGQNLLHRSVKEDNSDEAIRYFISNGFSVNSVDNKGDTTLHYALSRGNLWTKASITIIETLLTLGADMTIKNYAGISALDKIQKMMRSNCAGGRTEIQEFCKQARREAGWVFEYIFKRYM